MHSLASRVDLVLPGDIHLEPVVVQSAGSVARQAGFSLDRVEDVKTIVGEAFVNAVEHGNRNRSERKVTIRFSLEPGSLQVDVLDAGSGFDPATIPEPRLAQQLDGRQSRRGWGVYLIRRLANRMKVRRRFPFGSCLSLTIHSELSPTD